MPKRTIEVFDWSEERDPALLLERDLTRVQAAKARGETVAVRMSVALGVRFSQHHPPVVFCGHTNNPFAFDRVEFVPKGKSPQ